MQANGQYQPAGQLQLTHPHLVYNTNGSNRGYENNVSCVGMGALVGRYAMHNVGVKPQSTQRQSTFVALNNPLLARSHQDYYANSIQNASNQSNTPPASLNQQVMRPQNTTISENPQSIVQNRNVAYYQSQVMLQKSLNQSLKPMMPNNSVPMTNPTTSSTMQRMCYTQQPAVQGQTSQQAACAPYTSVAFSNVPNAQNAQIYSVSPVTLSPTSCVNTVVANNQSAQKNFVSQTNDSCAMLSVNGCAPPSNLMGPNNANSQSSSPTAAPFHAQPPPYPSQKHVQRTYVSGNVHMQTAQPVILATNDSSFNASSAPLPPQTCLQKDVSAQSHLQNMRAAPQQTNMSLKDHSAHHLDSLFYHKINDVSNNLNVCAPLNPASELSRCEALAKIDPVSSAQAKDCSLLVSPGRATRAVAVVLPLSQENSPNKHPSPPCLSPSNPASDSSFISPKQPDKVPIKTSTLTSLKWMLQKSTSSSNISADKADAQAPSPLKQMQLSVQDTGTKLSALPLSFAQLVEGNYSAKLHRRRKSKSEHKRSPTGQKLCEEKLSSVPTTAWTLKMLHEKISELEKSSELENKKTERKKSENIEEKNYCVKQIIIRFWNGDCRALFNEAKNGGLNNEVSKIREYIHKIDDGSVILSQNQTKNPSRYQLLLHDEVYEEKNPYTSVWLNIHQLDDIDKEFGLPYFLNYGKGSCKSVDAEPKSGLEDTCQTEIKLAIPKAEEPLNKDPSNPIRNSPNVNILTDAEKRSASSHVDPDTEKGAEENDCVSNAQSDDSSYSFKIQVLPPEKAKVIFEQTDYSSLQMVDSTVSEDIQPNDNGDSAPCHVSTLEKICCIEKWKEKVLGLPSETKCKCEEQNQDEEKLEHKEIEDCWPMGTVDLTDDDEYVPLFTQESEKNQEDKNQLLITVSSEGEDESQVAENSHGTHTDPHDEDEQCLIISTEGQEDLATNESTLENSNALEREMMSEKSSEQVQDCSKVPEDSGVKMTEASNPASLQPASTSAHVKERNKRLGNDPDSSLHPSKKTKLSCQLRSQTILESFSKSKNSGHVETVELALFGSKNKKCPPGSSRTKSSHTRKPSSAEEMEQAPRTIYVKFSPLTKSDKQEAKPSDVSVRTRLLEKWRNSFPLATIKLRRKNKKFAIVSANHGVTAHPNPSKHKDKRVASKRKIRDSDDDQDWKKKRSRRDGNGVNIPKKPVDTEARPLQKNVLKFNVLPNTFNFQEGSNDGDSTTDPKADKKIVLVPAGGNPHINTKDEKAVCFTAEGNPLIVQPKGAWCDESTSKSSPQSPAPLPESTGLFQEFQRRYKLRQASTDE